VAGCWDPGRGHAGLPAPHRLVRAADLIPENIEEAQLSYQAYLDTIKKNTGKSPDDFRKLADKKGLLKPGVKARQVTGWLKEEFGLGPGHAMAMYGAIKPSEGPPLTTPEQIDKHFTGRRAEWRETYAQLMTKMSEFGPEVSAQATNAYISVLRGQKKFAILQVTADRLDVGVKLKGHDPTARLRRAGTWNAMVTHRVAINAPGQVDAELMGWLRMAYDHT
jgi:hypothetical protein